MFSGGIEVEHWWLMGYDSFCINIQAWLILANRNFFLKIFSACFNVNGFHFNEN